MLVVGENPSFANLVFETDFPIFLFAFSLGSFVLFLLFLKARNKQRLQKEAQSLRSETSRDMERRA
ncbi:MAG TPA: hypothetical protein DF383_12295 [Deltaproteobacteria bacterium]|nr:hypothetical protein [Deltaproteobacteria bacterium]